MDNIRLTLGHRVPKQDIRTNRLIKPALNAYIYTKRLLKVTFEKVKGTPKIDALILVKGEDA